MPGTAAELHVLRPCLDLRDALSQVFRQKARGVLYSCARTSCRHEAIWPPCATESHDFEGTQNVCPTGAASLSLCRLLCRCTAVPDLHDVCGALV